MAQLGISVECDSCHRGLEEVGLCGLGELYELIVAEGKYRVWRTGRSPERTEPRKFGR